MHFCKSANKENLIGMLKPDIDKGFEALELIRHAPAARAQYEAKRNYLLDYNNSMDRAYEEGLQKGIAQGKREGLVLSHKRKGKDF